MDVSVAEWLASLTSNCGRIGAIGFGTPVVEHWLKREIAQWDHHEWSIRRPIAPWANALTQSYISFLGLFESVI